MANNLQQEIKNQPLKEYSKAIQTVYFKTTLFFVTLCTQTILILMSYLGAKVKEVGLTTDLVFSITPTIAVLLGILYIEYKMIKTQKQQGYSNVLIRAMTFYILTVICFYSTFYMQLHLIDTKKVTSFSQSIKQYFNMYMGLVVLVLTTTTNRMLK